MQFELLLYVGHIISMFKINELVSVMCSVVVFKLLLITKVLKFKTSAYICHHYLSSSDDEKYAYYYAQVSLVSSFSLLCFLNDLNTNSFLTSDMVLLDNVALIVFVQTNVLS